MFAVSGVPLRLVHTLSRPVNTCQPPKRKKFQPARITSRRDVKSFPGLLPSVSGAWTGRGSRRQECKMILVEMIAAVMISRICTTAAAGPAWRRWSFPGAGVSSCSGGNLQRIRNASGDSCSGSEADRRQLQRIGSGPERNEIERRPAGIPGQLQKMRTNTAGQLQRGQPAADRKRTGGGDPRRQRGQLQRWPAAADETGTGRRSWRQLQRRRPGRSGCSQCPHVATPTGSHLSRATRAPEATPTGSPLSRAARGGGAGSTRHPKR